MVESAKKFGVELKDMQIEAVLSFIGGRDTFVSLLSRTLCLGGKQRMHARMHNFFCLATPTYN